MHAIVARHADHYAKAKRWEKPIITSQVVNEIKDCNTASTTSNSQRQRPPVVAARFLKLAGSTKNRYWPALTIVRVIPIDASLAPVVSGWNLAVGNLNLLGNYTISIGQKISRVTGETFSIIEIGIFAERIDLLASSSL